MNKKYTMSSFLKLLSGVCSVSGDTDILSARLKALGEDLGFVTGVDLLGSVAFFLGGPVSAVVPTVVVMAHLDTVGYLVSDIIYSDNTLELVTTGSPEYYDEHEGVISTKSGFVDCIINREKTDDDNTMYLAEAVVSADDFSKVSKGDCVMYKGDLSRSIRGKLQGPYIDNRAGILSVLGVLQDVLKKSKLIKYRLFFVFSSMEEIDGGGAIAAVNKIKPDIIVNVDVTPVETKRELSLGTYITYNPYINRKAYDIVCEKAEKKNIKHASSISYPAYGSDVDVLYQRLGGIPCIEIGPACTNIHTPIEETAISGIKNTSKLLKEILFSIEDIYKSIGG